VSVAPGRLSQAAGVSYEEFSNLREPVLVRSTGELTLSDGAAGTLWADGLLPSDADTLARYEHPRFGEFAAVTTRTHGEGRITVVGTVPSAQFAADIVRWAAPATHADAIAADRALPVTVSSGTLPDGRKVWFVFNWSAEPQTFTPSADLSDAVTAEQLTAGSEISLPAWSTRCLVGR
jgi:beta-galactosidase